MKKVYNWGILAPGRIARKFALELKELDNARIFAVGSRDKDRAGEFGSEFEAERIYGNYEGLAADPDVDIIYIASPNSMHREHARLCLENNKAVLCEKPLAINLGEVNDMISLASEKNLFFMEAMMVPHQPSYKEAKEIVGSGSIGSIKYIQGWFGFNKSPYDLSHRLFDPMLGGGTLLDIGIYPVFDTLYFLGTPDSINASADLASTGIDQTVSARFDYGNGVTASVFASFFTTSGVGTDIFCEGGTLRLRRLSAVDQWLEIDIPGKKIKHMTWESKLCGLKQEAAEVMKSLDAGVIEGGNMPFSMSFKLMETLDKIRKEAGIYYEGRD